MAVIQAELRRDAAAKLLLERALTVNPTIRRRSSTWPCSTRNRATADRALELFRQILEIDPSWHDALVRIAYAETVREPDGEIVTKPASRAAPLEPRSAHAREPAFRARQGARRLRALRRGLRAVRARQCREPATPLALRPRSGQPGRGDRSSRASSPELMARATPVSRCAARLHHRHVPLRLDALRAGARRAPGVTAGGEIEYFMRFPLSLDPADWPAIAAGLRRLPAPHASRARTSSPTSGRTRLPTSAC